MGEARAAVEQFWTAVEADDFDAVTAGMAEDVRFSMPGMVAEGTVQLRAILEGYKRAFPDLAHEFVKTIEDGDTIVAHVRVTGTNTGPMGAPDGSELPPTGRAAVWNSVDWVVVRDGKVATWEVFHDPTPFLVAVGLMPEPAAA